MNAITFGRAARDRLGIVSDEPKPDKPLDAAWIVLEHIPLTFTRTPHA
ncbi:MAG TPA: hypothetical protein VIJ35_14400 [Bradyrhizobium sp.]